MKKTKGYFLIIALFCFSANLSAQLIQDTIQKNKAFESSIFSENLYLDIDAGTQILFSKEADKLVLRERFTPLFSFGIGKWFSPYLGVRVQSQGYALNGFSTVNSVYPADSQSGTADPVQNYVTIRPDGSYRYFLRYINTKLDFQVSLLNLINGYDELKRTDLISSLGVGFMKVMNYKGVPNTNSISANFELKGKYHLSKKIDINFIVQTSLLPDNFDGRIAGEKYENYSSASLGISYYFKKRGFKRVECLPHIPIIDKIKEIDTVYKIVNKFDTVYRVINKVDTVYKIISWEEALNSDNKLIKRDLKEIQEKKYKIKMDDCLSDIALKFYNEASIWPLIYKANKVFSPDPELLKPGIEISLPALEGSKGNLSILDKRNIAQGYMNVYLFYKDIDKNKAIYYLWVVKKLDKSLLKENANQINRGDIDLLNDIRNITNK